LKLAEWVALIHLHRTLGDQPTALKRAIAAASEHLGAEAAMKGRPRPGTKLRSTSGLTRRLSVVRAMAAGRRADLPSEALAAWRMFETAPNEGVALALATLEGVVAPGRPVLGHGAAPARGPAPAFGKFELTREDGATDVYLMRLGGLRSQTLVGTSDGRIFVKIGRSGEPFRRLDEMNWGFPPGCGLSWQLVSKRSFACSKDAHDFEQALLGRLHGERLTIGGEYALVPEKLVPSLLYISKMPEDASACDGHLRPPSVDAN
jgi:hypothetical protein